MDMCTCGFTDHLAQIILNQELDYRRLQNNVRPRRSSTRFTNQRNAHCRRTEFSYEWKHFLKTIFTYVLSFYTTM